MDNSYYFTTKLILDGGSASQIELKNLAGLSVEEAKKLYEGENINIEIAEEVYNKEVEEGKIISQIPPFEEDKTIDENSTIKLTVSKGTEMVKIEKANVVGKKYEDVEKYLKDELKLEIEKIEETSKTVEEGNVIKYSPDDEKEIETGSTVKVYVSKGTGIKKVVVPYVIGKSEAEVKKDLADLEVTIVYEEDMTKTTGKATKQSIEAGETVDEGTKITVTINRIEDLKTATIIVNLKSVLGDKSTIEKDAQGNEINPTVNFRIEVDGDNVYREEHQRKDSTNITQTIQGKGTVTVKIFVDEIKYREEQLTLSDNTQTLTID